MSWNVDDSISVPFSDALVSCCMMEVLVNVVVQYSCVVYLPERKQVTHNFVKIRGEVVSSLILGKRIFRVPPTGVEPMTFP